MSDGQLLLVVILELMGEVGKVRARNGNSEKTTDLLDDERSSSSSPLPLECRST